MATGLGDGVGLGVGVGEGEGVALGDGLVVGEGLGEALSDGVDADSLGEAGADGATGDCRFDRRITNTVPKIANRATPTQSAIHNPVDDLGDLGGCWPYDGPVP